ncbi:MAG TPA: phosphoenolpyruvate--protein phosphotransferase [Treponemataceae bacterium]|jgi:phosphotransferase system enzyme I (PtsI)|nr:phosphoenolpyruvate--protein phosphotransferase [Treponemataceae bacterium]
MNILSGISASKGLAIEKAHFIVQAKRKQVEKTKISQSEKEAEWKKFQKALELTIKDFSLLLQTNNPDEKKLIETYLLMLNDQEFINQIKLNFDNSSYNVDFIVDSVVNESASLLRHTNDEYLSQRADDILDVFGKVIDRILGNKIENIQDIDANSIVVSQNISGSFAISLFQKGIKGLLLSDGGLSSHTAILARSYGIPFIFGIHKLSEHISHGDTIILDANEGSVYISPDLKTIEKYQKLKKEAEERENLLAQYINKKGKTKDKVEINLFANIGSVEEADLALKHGAEGIGLFRTEFLFMDAERPSDLLDETKQYQVYSEVLKIMGEKSVVIRTLDAGGDKVLSVTENSISKNGKKTKYIKPEIEENPLLGNRAIRFCLDKKDIFKTQLRALLRASIDGNLSIMLPLITHKEQVLETKALIDEIKKELTEKNIAFKKDVPLGIMIETPAAAILAEDFAEIVDFFSIGTNDLTQYTLCVDRENTGVSALYQEMHPAVLALIEMTSKAAKKHNIPISVCGEMAAREDEIKALLKRGIRSLSMRANKISEVKAFLETISLKSL